MKRNGAIVVPKGELSELARIAHASAARAARPAKPRAAAKDQEHQDQCAVVAWARENAERDPRLHLLFAVPNQAHVHGKAGMSRGKREKAEGRRRGVPDLLLPCAGSFNPYQGAGGLAIEMKTEKGVVSAEQRWWLGALRAQGWACFVCRSADDAIGVLRWYLGHGQLGERPPEGAEFVRHPGEKWDAGAPW